MNYNLLIEYIDLLLEKKKKVTVKNMPKAYGKGTKASNKSMAREINKCANPKNRPKSCYDYWDADKKYDKSKKKKLKESYAFDEGFIIVYPFFQGADVSEDYNSTNYPVEILPTHLMIGNEPAKDRNYFMTDKKEYIQKMITDVNQYGLDTIPPIVAIRHPLIPGHYSVLDGNHRLGAFKIAGIKKIPTIIIDETDIFLASPDTEWFEGINPDAIPLIEAEQNNYNLNDYFAKNDLL